MTSNTAPQASPGSISPATIAALEKIPHAARRMGMSVSQFYRTAKRDGLRIIKVSERSSAVVSGEVDAWIQKRIEASRGVAK
jgi:predicted DNA-binding transcriptional regulator AlpA